MRYAAKPILTICNWALQGLNGLKIRLCSFTIQNPKAHFEAHAPNWSKRGKTYPRSSRRKGCGGESTHLLRVLR